MIDRIIITISRETAERVEKLHGLGDTFDAILKRLLDEYEGKEKNGCG